MSHPVDNLVRAWASPGAVTLRTKTGEGGPGADNGGSTMFGHFAVFDQWTEIHSYFEGDFLERIAPGAFGDTFRAKAGQIRVLYDHGQDPSVGSKPLGSPDILREDANGAYYEVSLFRPEAVGGFDVKPALSAKQLGASFRFKVIGEEWVTRSEATKDNPSKLDERTITKVDLYEFGPVTFPAYPHASAGLRSRSDEFMSHFFSDPIWVAKFKTEYGPKTLEHIRASLPTAAAEPVTPTAPPQTEPPTERSDATPDEIADGDTDDNLQRRIAHFQRVTAGFDAHQSRLKEAP